MLKKLKALCRLSGKLDTHFRPDAESLDEKASLAHLFCEAVFGRMLLKEFSGYGGGIGVGRAPGHLDEKDSGAETDLRT